MAKRKVIRRSNKPINIYEDGGDISGFEKFINSDTYQGIRKGISAFSAGASSLKGQPSFLSLSRASGTGLYGAIGSAVDDTGQLLSGIDALLTKKRRPMVETVGLVSSNGNKYADGGSIMNIGTTALELAGNAIQQAQIEDTSELKSQIKQYGNAQLGSNNYDDLMNDWASRTELQHISTKDLRNKSLFSDFADSVSASGKGFAAGSAFGPVGSIVGGIIGGGSSLIGSFIGRKKARKERRRVNKQIDIANERNLLSYEDRAKNIESQNDFGTLASFAAYGGPLGIWGGYGSNAIGYELAKEDLDIKALNAANKSRLTSLPNSFESPDMNTFAVGGKIHIKPENRGKFTKYCGGEVTSECIARGKRSSNPAVRKRATFAANARKWKHSSGGNLFQEGGDTSEYRVDFNNYVPTMNRGFISGNMEQLQDSLISRGLTPAQRTAIMSAVLHESGGDPKAKSDSGKYRGLLQWGPDRYPNTEDLGEQIHYLIESSRNSKSPNWSDGGEGVPTINRAVDGYNAFWDGDLDSYNLGLYYNKGYVRPKEEQARINRAVESRHMYESLEKRKNKKAFGGDLLTHGANFDTGVTLVGNGGTHEENPLEGVPMGVDAEGTPNLVEEGEAIFNDYVFSNRMLADGGLLESFNLPKSYDGYSFAAIAEKLGEESKERPNDPISKRGLLSSMSRLQQAQETIRQQNQAGQEGVQYAHGGKMGMLFDGTGDEPNLLDTDDTDDTDDDSSKLVWLRYAPLLGSAIGIGQNLFSKPDYTSADTILEAANQVGNYTPIDYTPIGNYLQYRPFDRNFYINKLNAQAGATRRAIMNTTSPSRSAALLAADYNAQGRLGDLARQAEEYNLAQRQQVEQFNRATNQANAEMRLKAAMANQEVALKAGSSKLSGVAQAMAVRDAIDARRDASLSANLTNLFDSLGNIGIDSYNRADRDMIIKSGVFGTLSQKPQEWSNKRWEDYKKVLEGTGYSKGGKLKKKKRGGLTY